MNYSRFQEGMMLLSKRLISSKIILFIGLIILLSQVTVDSLAECILPNCLTIIDEEVFQGDISLESVIIPNSVTAICSRAFADTAIYSIDIPSSVISIATDTFENVKTPLLIVTSPDSFAVSYALNSSLDFTAETTCRALVVGQTDYPGRYKLEGAGKDIVNIQSALQGYNVTTETNLNADEILASIHSAFADATKEDISLFYYCGHGNASDGALIGIDMESYVTPNGLRLALDAIPGRKIVLVDACYSGALIGRSTTKSDEESADPASLFICSFIERQTRHLSTLEAQQYFVMASSKGDEESWETSYGGLFTTAFINSKELADANSDDVVSFEEAYQYVRKNVSNFAASGGKVQSVQVYPENCYWFGLFR